MNCNGGFTIKNDDYLFEDEPTLPDDFWCESGPDGPYEVRHKRPDYGLHIPPITTPLAVPQNFEELVEDEREGMAVEKMREPLDEVSGF